MSLGDRIRKREHELMSSRQHAHNLTTAAGRVEQLPSTPARRRTIAQLLGTLRRSHDHARLLEHELAELKRQARHVDHAHPLPRGGVDYAWDHPLPAQLRAAGATFACRYVTGGPGKGLSTLEAENLSGAGIDVVAIFEQAAGRAGEGYAAGAADARTAAAALGRISRHAAERPIYFACDFDAGGEGRTDHVMEYLRGAVHAIGWHRVGLYAGLEPITVAHSLNRCRYLWQTFAWSGGKWSPHAQLRQVQNDRRIAGHDIDIDLAVAADFGQWRT